MSGTVSGGANLRYIIIGAGMSGLLTMIKLKERGETNFAVYEKGDSVGGTWRENRYPGLACDTPAHSYAYSFAYNPNWSSYFAPGSEIRAYFEKVATDYNLHADIQFNTEVEACDWIDGQWHVKLKNGKTDVGDVLIAASGVLHRPSYPDIPGLADFAGPCMHSARWDDSVELKGKRIGVIGGGSTAVQIVSALVAQSAQLVHFVRSVQWIMPAVDKKYSAEERAAFAANPALIEEVRNGPDAAARRARFTAAIIDKDSPQLAEIQAIVEKNLEDSVRDPVLREKLRPNYRAACKRMIFSPDYYEAIQHPNAVLELGAIERIEANGVRMKDGTFHELDVIALCTGFDVTSFMRPMKFHGEGGLDLDDYWSPNPAAYYAVTIPHFPNLFLYNGPTGPVGNFSLIDISEAQWGYMDRLIDQLRQGKAKAIAPKPEALATYLAAHSERAKQTVFASGCKSWYLDANGTPLVWPWSYAHFVEMMENPKLEDYQLAG